MLEEAEQLLLAEGRAPLEAPRAREVQQQGGVTAYRIRDPEGTEGWVHQSTLMGRRSFVVRGAPGSEVMLRRRAEDQASPVARLRPGVVGRLRACEPANPWCEAQIGEYRGFVKRTDIWGVGTSEEVK